MVKRRTVVFDRSGLRSDIEASGEHIAQLQVFGIGPVKGQLFQNLEPVVLLLEIKLPFHKRVKRFHKLIESQLVITKVLVKLLKTDSEVVLPMVKRIARFDSGHPMT